MAASSSSSSDAKKYDVFISFRGEDTRFNFTSHLVSALRRNSVRVYVDYELRKGDEISPSLTNAIYDSYGSLVIFSENYASSGWCLNELRTILEQRKQGYFIVPVFYNIDPSHVRKQAGSYEKAFAKHEDDKKNKEMLQLWKATLTEVANIGGWDSQSPTNRDESELIEKIVKDVQKKLAHLYEIKDSRFVEIDRYCKDIESLLERSRVVGIWGMGGVGKTTIAKVVFDKLYGQYDCCHFFENVREESERNGINYIRDQLQSELFENENFHKSTLKGPALKYATRMLSSKKVLIILDDVDSSEQLEYLQQECNSLRAGSNIIITTRDKHLLNDFGDYHSVYEVRELNFKKSLQLFRLYAFNESYPKIGYEEITEKFVGYAGGIPLALKVLGRFLRSKSKEEWESTFEKLNKIPNNDIQKVLRLSYDALDHLEQQIFLDIACFLKGECFEHVVSFLDTCGFCGHIGIKTLQDKALVTIYDGAVQMHDLIQEMGRHIDRGVSINSLGEHSRLWNPKEIYYVLKSNKGTDRIEAITLNMSTIEDLPLGTDALKKMTNLRFLKISDYAKSSRRYHPGCMELCSDKLSYFHWDCFPFHSLSLNSCAERLVMLRMPFSNMTKLWDGLQDLVNLKEIELIECHQLMELPDLSNASKLELVNLSWCINLCHIHPSLLHLDNLVYLNVDYCQKLMGIQSESHLNSLRRLSFRGCSSLKEFSVSSEKIRYLHFEETAVDILPSSIGRSRNLEVLEFKGPVTKIPSLITKLTSLKVLNIDDCRGFNSSELPVIFDALPSLKELSLTRCYELSQLPDNISFLSSLNKLTLTASNVESLPTSIKHLPCLKHLDVSRCQRLRSLPELPPSTTDLEARNCPILERLIPSTRLEHCHLEYCVKLDQQSIEGVMAAVHYRIKRAEPSTVGLPGDRVPRWFRYWTTQDRISIELPPRSDLLGFAFCFTVSHTIFFVECVCYLEDGETEEFASEWVVNRNDILNSGCTYLWYDHSLSDSLNAMEGRAHDRVSFQLCTGQLSHSVARGESTALQMFGVWPIYASEMEMEIGDSDTSKRAHFDLEADEQQQHLPLANILEKFQHDPPELELKLSTKSCICLDIQGIEIEGSDHENHNEQEPLLIDKQIQGDFNFQPLPTEYQMLNDNNEALDFFKDLELDDKRKRLWCEPEVDDELQPSLTKKFKESTLQPDLKGLDMELSTRSNSYFGIEGIQVGSSSHEKQDEQQPLHPDKGIQGILLPNQNPDAER